MDIWKSDDIKIQWNSYTEDHGEYSFFEIGGLFFDAAVFYNKGSRSFTETEKPWQMNVDVYSDKNFHRRIEDLLWYDWYNDSCDAYEEVRSRVAAALNNQGISKGTPIKFVTK